MDNYDVCICGKPISKGKAGVLVHANGDTWCDPKQNVYAVEYRVAKVKE